MSVPSFALLSQIGEASNQRIEVGDPLKRRNSFAISGVLVGVSGNGHAHSKGPLSRQKQGILASKRRVVGRFVAARTN